MILSQNEIESIAPLEDAIFAYSLEYLDIRNNKIKDLSPLINFCPNLYIFAKNNFVDMNDQKNNLVFKKFKNDLESLKSNENSEISISKNSKNSIKCYEYNFIK